MKRNPLLADIQREKEPDPGLVKQEVHWLLTEDGNRLVQLDQLERECARLGYKNVAAALRIACLLMAEIVDERCGERVG